ncbi:hypothetical protein BDK51DRAFT_26729 [Blyttiomyces helicus]|uniref:Uncharacterized protein n=1 Tax=Blyttiomyces helicus TaxID=388810 RepID=A0A4P9VXM0_9FUNG|nr:hypothetical protein BDK51DRAFT_26729 [Blyttiomyces helicus]|eukprot:RKO83982.1 hypothetical protein BDK51DRAFT_26729 [Blyttiomyces helicus]
MEPGVLKLIVAVNLFSRLIPFVKRLKGAEQKKLEQQRACLLLSRIETRTLLKSNGGGAGSAFIKLIGAVEKLIECCRGRKQNKIVSLAATCVCSEVEGGLGVSTVTLFEREASRPRAIEESGLTAARKQEHQVPWIIFCRSRTRHLQVEEQRIQKRLQWNFICPNICRRLIPAHSNGQADPSRSFADSKNKQWMRKEEQPRR